MLESKMEKNIQTANTGLIVKYVNGQPNNENHRLMENREENINTIYTISCYTPSFNSMLQKKE